MHRRSDRRSEWKDFFIEERGHCGTSRAGDRLGRDGRAHPLWERREVGLLPCQHAHRVALAFGEVDLQRAFRTRPGDLLRISKTGLGEFTNNIIRGAQNAIGSGAQPTDLARVALSEPDVAVAICRDDRVRIFFVYGERSW